MESERKDEATGMKLRLYAALVLAVLSVNNYPLEKAWQIRSALERAGLFDPETLASLSVETVFLRLRNAGYDRGEFLTDLLASRLHSVGEFIVNYGVENATRVLSTGNAAEVQRMLTEINGIGRTVVSSFLLLRG